MLDGLFSIIDKIWRYEFFNNEYVGKIFSGALIVAGSWLALKVVIELIMNFIVKNEGRGSPLTIYRGLALAIIMMFFIPALFNFGHEISTALTDSVISVTNSNGSSAEKKISRAIVQSMIYPNETYENDAQYLVKNWNTVDINSSSGGIIGIGDSYKYSVNFFMLIVFGLVTLFLLFFIAIQMAKRVMEIALYKIIGPFCCSSLTSNGKAFETWIKSTMGAFLITVVQFVCIGLLLNMFGNAMKDTGVLTGLFLILGALLFIISTPTIISSLLGQQSGMMSAFGDMQSLMAVGHGITSGLGIAGAGVSSALSLGSKVITKGANGITKGVGKISDMLNRGNNLTKEQKEIFENTISHHNRYKANQQSNQFAKENSKVKYNSANIVKSDSFRQPFNMRYNPIRNQYTNHAGLQTNNNIGIGGDEL